MMYFFRGLKWISYRRDLLGQFDILCQNHLALLQRTLEVHIAELITKIGGLRDQSDKAIFDDQVDICALHNFIPYGTAGRDSELFATIEVAKVSKFALETTKESLGVVRHTLWGGWAIE